MRKFARAPAIFILLALGGAAALSLRARPAANPAGGKSIGDLERAIADGNADAVTWLNYGEKLRAAARFARAAEAYRRALDVPPSPASAALFDAHAARFGLALSLAQADKPDAFFDNMQQLILTDAKLASDILARRECQSKQSDPRFAPMVKEAQAQAVD